MNDKLIPPEKLVPELPSDVVSDSEANSAAKTLGMSFFSAEKSRLLRKVGLYQTQQGVIQLGVGRLAAADEAIQRMLETAVLLSEDSTLDPKPRIEAIVAGNALVGSLQRSITLAAEFLQEKLINGPTNGKKRTFVDESPVIPIQANAGSVVNVSVDNTSKVEQTK